MERLDAELVRRGLIGSRTRAAAAVLAGEVLVDGRPARKPGERVAAGAALALRGPDHPYVGRGGLKLEAALQRFALDPTGWECLDVGAAVGGFTDCLLQHGARHVTAVDVGYGQLAWRLRTDPRVLVHERVNARYLTAEHVPRPVDLAVCDVSFISLAKVLPAVLARVRPQGRAVCLVKPQFEAGPADVPAGGVVRDPAVHRRVLAAVAADVARLGWPVQALMASPLKGADGNREFLALLAPPPAPAIDPLVQAALVEAAGVPG